MKAHGLFLVLLQTCVANTLVLAGEATVARIGASGDALEFEQRVNGETVKGSVPLYTSAGVRYFSAGVGLEERAAQYPPFALKIVLTAGGKPFLTGVAVTIQPAKGGTAIAIPSEQVEGPWLFVDVAPGLYDVTATDGEYMQRLHAVKVEAGKQKVVYLRWEKDRGITSRLPPD
ncbi:MAG TPA: hypothetical protein VIU63_07605 [Nitrospira sp.]